MSTHREETPDAGIMSGEIWDRFCSTLERTRSLVTGDAVPAGPGDRAQGFRYLADLLAAGLTVCVEHGDSDHPEFCRMIDHSMKWGLDAPDCLYLFASVSNAHGYRIHGNVGSAAHIDIQVNWGHFAEGDISKWGTISSIDSSSLPVDDDGHIDLRLSTNPTSTNNLMIDERAEFVLIRQYFGDWNQERPGDLVIERVGQGHTPTAPSTTDMAKRYARLCDWMEKAGALWESMSQGMLEMEPNTVFVNDPAASAERAGMRGQIYCMGNFACKRDEAVIVEFPAPNAKFWSLGLANWYWQSLDYATHQSSLNMVQARQDEDGRVRMVIAQEDPGVANWIDPCGQETGTLIIRCLLAEETISPTITCVAREDLDSVLPESTARTSQPERTRILHDRHAAVLARFRR